MHFFRKKAFLVANLIFRKVFGRSLQPSAWVVSKNSAEIEMEMNIR